MYNLVHHLHFVGIGGIGMAGIAEVCVNLGYPVSGSDLNRSAAVDHLESLGIPVNIGHRAENIPTNASTVVVSTAIPDHNCELLAAKERKLTVIRRAEMLAEIVRMKYGVCVAGSHGKTTTSSMLAKILFDGGHDPTVIIGGRILSEQSGARTGTGAYAVAEADESDGSFSLLKPAIAVVTNIDVEHLSHYGSVSALEEAFKQFMASVPFYGLVVVCGDDPVLARLAKSIDKRVVTYGLGPGNEIFAENIFVEGNLSHFSVVTKEGDRCEVSVPLPGLHMVSNALAAISVGLELGLTLQEIASSLGQFSGVARRSQLLIENNGVRVFDDYAHHPTEIRATLRALKAGWVTKNSAQVGRIHVVFQPHRYSRTKELFAEFLAAFDDADHLSLLEIYPAGEKPLEGISSEKLLQALNHSSATLVGDRSELYRSLQKQAVEGDIVVFLGAGNVSSWAKEFVATLADPNGR